MKHHQQSTLLGNDNPAAFRTTARIVGVIYLAGMVIGIAGNLMIEAVVTDPAGLSTVAASGLLLAVGAVLWLLTVVGDAAHGVLMFPVLKLRSERLALAYLTARIMDAVLIAVMVLLVLVQIPLGMQYLDAGAGDASALPALSAIFTQAKLYAYEVAMMAVGVAGLILCSGFYRATLIPRPLAIWGLVGYAILLAGSILQVLGFELHSIHAGVGGLWEVFIGVWLIVKGFNPVPPRPVEPADWSTPEVVEGVAAR